MKTITRQQTFDMFDANWCVSCGKTTKQLRVTTGLPGIYGHKCATCDVHTTVNFLEDGADILEVPDHLKIMDEEE